MEIHLRTLVFVVMSLLGSLSLPLVAGFLPAAEPSTPLAALPTATPVPLRGLSPAARSLAATLDAPPPLPTTTAAVTARVATDGANLNLRSGPGLTFPVVGSAAPGQSLTVTGVSADGEWLRVDLPDTDGSAWAFRALVDLPGVDGLPLVAGG
jgi:uncharacterized protein YgiM (DUF1202 family)